MNNKIETIPVDFVRMWNEELDKDYYEDSDFEGCVRAWRTAERWFKENKEEAIPVEYINRWKVNHDMPYQAVVIFNDLLDNWRRSC